MSIKINSIAPKLAKYQTVVDKRLVRGRAVTSPFRLYKMKQAGITQVIDLRGSSYVKRPIEKFFCKMFGIKYNNLKYPLDSNVVPEHKFFENVNNAIVNNNGKTYIHCGSGKKRTSVCVAVYEKSHTLKTDGQIISNVLKTGFEELNHGKYGPKRDKLLHIFKDLAKKYFPEHFN